jgi:GNAT superfamily N-acetyltransferase
MYATPEGHDMDTSSEFPPVDRVALRDGCCSVLRPLERRAGSRPRRVVSGLSPESRAMRFHAAIRDLPEPMRAALTAADPRRHMAWVAEECARPGAIVAEAHYVTADDEAEVALSVADPLQRHGLGRALLGRLVRHTEAASVRWLRGHVRADNEPMLRLTSTAGLARPLAADRSAVVVEHGPEHVDEVAAVDGRGASAVRGCGPRTATTQQSRTAALRTVLTVGLPAVAALLLPGGILVAVLAGLVRHWRMRSRTPGRFAEHPSLATLTRRADRNRAERGPAFSGTERVFRSSQSLALYADQTPRRGTGALFTTTRGDPS